jgi:hypothetical protein
MTTPTPPPATPSVVELLGAMLVRVVMDICGRVSWGGITQPQSSLLFMRLNGIKRQIDRIVARIRAGTYKPRRRTGKPAARASPRQPRPPSPLPATFGWLMPLIPKRPEEYWHANGFSQGVEAMLNTPEMVALVEAAPVSLGRPLRSLCWALRLKPPPHLAPPRRTNPTRTPRTRTPPRAAAPRLEKPRATAKPKGPPSAPLTSPPLTSPPLTPPPPALPAPPALPDWLRDWPLAGWRSRCKTA